MRSIDQYGEALVELSEFVKRLEEPVRAEAFKFLLDREFGAVSTPPPAQAAVQAQPLTGSRVVAPQELIRRSGASTLTEKAVVLAYWLEKYQNRATFSSSDMKEAFRQAREQAPRNPSDLVAKLESTARIMKAETAEEIQHYCLTSTAVDAVESKLNGEAVAG